MANILIIDDDKVICDILTKMMEKIGHDARYAMTGADGVNLAENEMFDIVFLDVNLPDVNGLDLIKIIKDVPSSPEVIIVTGEDNADGANIAIKSGAWNYLEKPFLRQDLNLQVSRALLFREEKGEIPATGALKRNAIVGDSKKIQFCLDRISTATYSDISVLISGEQGTGKELFAKTIHLNSDRSKNNFVVVDCSAMNEVVFKSMLFGSKNSLASEALDNKLGLMNMADGGTLFLDNVFELPIQVQQSLLQVIEEQKIYSLDRKENKICNFRVMASTCEDFDTLKTKDAFLPDLFNKLNAIHIKAPSLKTIKEDIIKIALFYIDQYCKKYKVDAKGVSPEFIDIIGAYKWPGNVKELIDAIEKAVASAKSEPTLYSIHLPSYIKTGVIKQILKKNIEDEKIPKKESHNGKFPPLNVFMETSEKQYLTSILSHVSGDIKNACQISGMSSSLMYERLRKFGLT